MIVMVDRTRINFDAVQRAIEFYGQEFNTPMQSYPEGYCEWLLEHWGLEHGEMFIKIVDEKKYTAFLLRFA